MRALVKVPKIDKPHIWFDGQLWRVDDLRRGLTGSGKSFKSAWAIYGGWLVNYNIFGPDRMPIKL